MKKLTLLLLGAVLLAATLPTQISHAQGCATEDTPGCTFGLPTETYNKLLAEMQTYPDPRVTEIKVDKEKVDAFTFFRIAPNAPKYDAPNGNVIGSAGDGFNFVSIYGTQDGFAKMRDGTWVSLQSLKRTYASEFAGVQFTEPMKYPMAWIIQSALTARIPGGVLRPSAPTLKRYQRVNIYATVRIGPWDWYLVGPGMWIEQRKVAKVDPALWPTGAPANVAPTTKWVAADLYEQTIKLYEGKNLIAATLISSGLPGTGTNEGTFEVYQRAVSTPMQGSMGQPDGWSLPAVPYVMFFDGDISLHGTYWHDGFGFKRSRGCVNLSISDARFLYNWVGEGDLTVVVWNSR